MNMKRSPDCNCGEVQTAVYLITESSGLIGYRINIPGRHIINVVGAHIHRAPQTGRILKEFGFRLCSFHNQLSVIRLLQPLHLKVQKKSLGALMSYTSATVPQPTGRDKGHKDSYSQLLFVDRGQRASGQTCVGQQVRGYQSFTIKAGFL